MMTRLKTVLQPERREDGITLAELMVAMVVLVVLLSAAGSLLVVGSKITTSSKYTALDSGVASNVMNEASRVVRYATVLPNVTNPSDAIPPFVTATPTTLVIYSFVDSSATASPSGQNPLPRMVGFSLDASGNLVEKRWNASATGTFPTPTATPASQRVLGGPLSTPTTTGAAAGACVNPNPLPTSTSTPTATPSLAPTAAAGAVVPLFTYCGASGPLAFTTGSTPQIPAASIEQIKSVVVTITMNTGAGVGNTAVVLTGQIMMQNIGNLGTGG